ncbi:uncharacterized protein LKV04_002996 [Tautogolabrus adspersus]
MNHTNQTEEDLFSCYSPSVVGYRYFAVLWGCAVTIIGTLGNLMTILAFALDPRLRTRFNALIINLAVADLLYCTILQPMSVDSYLHLRWRSGQLWCSIFGLLLFLSYSVSIITLCLVAVSRYLLVVKRAMFDRIFSNHGLILPLMSVWALGLASVGPLWSVYVFVPQVCTCSCHRTSGRLYTTILLFVYFAVGLGCVGVFYFLIHRHVMMASQALVRYRFSRRSSRRNAASSQGTNDSGVETGIANTGTCELSSQPEKNPNQEEITCDKRSQPTQDSITASNLPIDTAPQIAAPSSNSTASSGDDKEMKHVTCMCLAVFLCFVFCFVPYFLLSMVDRHTRAPQLLYMFCGNITWLNSCINPILYAVINRQFRQSYHMLLTRAVASFTWGILGSDLQGQRMLMNHTNQTEEDLFSCYSPSVVGYRYFAVLWGCAVTIIGTLGNLMTILAFALDQRLRTRFNALIINLAVADLLYCTILQPMSVDSYLYLRWRSGQLWCSIFGLLLSLFYSVSTITLCLVAVSRYLLVAKRAMFDRIFSNHGLILLLMSVWALGLASVGPFWPVYVFVPQVCTCSCHRTSGRPYTTILFFVYFIVGLGCVGVFYFLIHRRVMIASQALVRYRFSRRSSRRNAASSQGTNDSGVETGIANTGTCKLSSQPEKNPNQEVITCDKRSQPTQDSITASNLPIDTAPQIAAPSSHSTASSGDDKEMKHVTCMCLAVFLCFVFCFVPYFLLNMVDRHTRAPQLLYMFCRNITWLNSCINPILYAVMNRQFRQSYHMLLTRAVASFTCQRS